jgi:hypothetical protein
MRLADKTETPAKKAAESKTEEPAYVSEQLAMKTWSVIARFLHEGAGIVALRKAWDTRNEELVVFPSYSGQDPDAMKPDVWMAWRHVLKPALGGHTYIRDFAKVVDAIPLHSKGALRILDSEFALTEVEALRRFESGSPGLVALILRVYHLPRSYKFYNVAEKEGDGEFVPLPFDVALDDLTPVLADDEFERRRSRIRNALGKA